MLALYGGDGDGGVCADLGDAVGVGKSGVGRSLDILIGSGCRRNAVERVAVRKNNGEIHLTVSGGIRLACRAAA